ncbi:hypothetical protein WDW89_23460 [Deltaproteobacteria bacterium TL4]
MDSIKITLNPEPGEYTHGIAVVFTKNKEDGYIEFKNASGNWEMLGNECYSAGLYDSTVDCLTINETQTIEYRVSTFSSDSDIKKANFTITPQKKDMMINGTSFTEEWTKCDFNSIDDSLDMRIKLSNNSVISGGKFIEFDVLLYVIPEIGTELKMTDSANTGISVKSIGDSPYGLSDFYVGRTDTDFCSVTFTEFNKGGKITGKISCIVPGIRFG